MERAERDALGDGLGVLGAGHGQRDGRGRCPPLEGTGGGTGGAAQVLAALVRLTAAESHEEDVARADVVGCGHHDDALEAAARTGALGELVQTTAQAPLDVARNRDGAVMGDAEDQCVRGGVPEGLGGDGELHLVGGEDLLRCGHCGVLSRMSWKRGRAARVVRRPRARCAHV